MDDAHIELLGALIKCHKPMSVLELGVGSGRSTIAINESLKFNGVGTLSCLDNLMLWRGQEPDHIKELKSNYPNNMWTNADEFEYIKLCEDKNIKFDFIVSDADHERAHTWIENTFNILNDDGIVIYHDVTNVDYLNLQEVIDYAKENNYRYLLFNKSTRSEERCERGTVVIFKS